MSEKGKNNKKKTGLGLAIWVLLFLIILIVFLVKQEEIKENFDKSGATELIEKKIGKQKTGDSNQNSAENGETIIQLNVKDRSKPSENQAKKADEKKEKVEKQEKKAESAKSEKNEAKEPKTEAVAKKEEVQRTESQPKASQKTETKASETTKKTTEKKIDEKNQKSEMQKKTVAQTQNSQIPQPAPPASNTIKAKICFVAIDSDGPVVRKEVSRNVAKDSPMGDALKMLLSGPSPTEEKTGCRSLIPAGTQLIHATVKNGIATLDFSEEFQFNQFGAEGSLAQLMQVVYTATNFNTVKGVQILIEGQKRDYLTEGVWIGSPLNRNSF